MKNLFIYHSKLWIAVAAGILVGLALPHDWTVLARSLTGWNVSIVLFLILTFIWGSKLNAEQICSRYAEEDASAPVILLISVLCALASLAAIVALLSTLRQVPPGEKPFHLALATLTVIDSWLLVPTMFTLHYADAYYSVDGNQRPLLFPQTERPLFFDFVYFAFTISAASQTADVATATGDIRRTVTLHTLVSFVFNASILGFAINVSAGLLG